MYNVHAIWEMRYPKSIILPDKKIIYISWMLLKVCSIDDAQLVTSIHIIKSKRTLKNPKLKLEVPYINY